MTTTEFSASRFRKFKIAKLGDRTNDGTTTRRQCASERRPEFVKRDILQNSSNHERRTSDIDLDSPQSRYVEIVPGLVDRPWPADCVPERQAPQGVCLPGLEI